MDVGPRQVVVVDPYALEGGLAGLEALIGFVAEHRGDHRFHLAILHRGGHGRPDAFEDWALRQGIQCYCHVVPGNHDRYIRFGRFVCEMGLGAELLAGQRKAGKGLANYTQFTMKSTLSAKHLLKCEADAQPRRGTRRR